MDKKVLVIGLDCATSEIVFDRKEEFPVLRELIDNSIYGTEKIFLTTISGSPRLIPFMKKRCGI